MKIEGYDITYLSEWDGMPVKNHLPVELRERFLTEKQWLERRKKLIDGAEAVEMHPNAMNKKLCKYYLDTQVTELTGSEKICATCSFRDGQYCIVAGDYIRMDGLCSEWISWRED